MKRLLTFAGLLAASFALASCEPQGADGYAFGEPTWVATDLDVNVVLLPSLEAMKQLRAEKGVPVPDNAVDYAFAEVAKSGRCTIYKVDSREHYAPEMDGHELNHCIYGEWHP